LNPTEGLLNIASVVPKEVELRAAPAEKAWRRGKEKNGVRRKERAMGARMPVRAMERERGRTEVRVGREVVVPPVILYEIGQHQLERMTLDCG
jgi:hypothetical protein